MQTKLILETEAAECQPGGVCGCRSETRKGHPQLERSAQCGGGARAAVEFAVVGAAAAAFAAVSGGGPGAGRHAGAGPAARFGGSAGGL